MDYKIKVVHYSENGIDVWKSAVVERNGGRQDIVLERNGAVHIFGENLLSVERGYNGQDILKSVDVLLPGANVLITVLESFRRGMVPKSMSKVWISESIQIEVSIVKQGTANLRLKKILTGPSQFDYPAIFLTPAQANNLEKCIYHVVSFLAKV